MCICAGADFIITQVWVSHLPGSVYWPVYAMDEEGAYAFAPSHLVVVLVPASPANTHFPFLGVADHIAYVLGTHFPVGRYWVSRQAVSLCEQLLTCWINLPNESTPTETSTMVSHADISRWLLNLSRKAQLYIEPKQKPSNTDRDSGNSRKESKLNVTPRRCPDLNKYDPNDIYKQRLPD